MALHLLAEYFQSNSSSSFSLSPPSMDLHRTKLHAYRMFRHIKSFDVTSRFIYIFTEGKIHQVPVFTNSSLSFPVELVPVQTFIRSDTLFIATKDKLFCFYDSPSLLRELEPLSTTFVHSNLIFTISSTSLSFVDPSDRLKLNAFHLIGNNGLCAAVCSSSDGSSILFGFENGKIFSLPDTLQGVAAVSFTSPPETSPGNIASASLIYDLSDPIISLASYSSFIYASLLSSRIARIDTHSSLFIFTNIPFVSKYLHVIPFNGTVTKHFILCGDSSRVVILSEELKVLRVFFSQLQINKVLIEKGVLYVGYPDLIVLYDIMSILEELCLIK